jgi:hypothetical protein
MPSFGGLPISRVINFPHSSFLFHKIMTVFLSIKVVLPKLINAFAALSMSRLDSDIERAEYS